MSLVLTNWADGKLTLARANTLSKRMAVAWISATVVIQVVLVWLHATR